MSIEVLPKLYQIIVPTPFAVGSVNCYVALSDPVTLIDTGPRHPDSRAALHAGLREIGLKTGDLRRILITHAHADHYGLAAELVRESGAEVWTHRHNRIMLENYESIRAQRNDFYVQIMTESGVPADERQRVADSRRTGDRFAESVAVARTLDEADRVELAGRAWQVYHMPGHAGGLITFFDFESRVLLSNDHLLREISSNPIVEPDPDGGPRPHRLVEYLHHLQRAVDLKPVIAWTSHGEPVHDVEKLVRQRVHFHSRRADKILGMIGDEERSAFQIAEPLFGRLNGIDSFLALSETIGHLDWLQEQGRVKTIMREGVIYWRRVEDGLAE
jgi:glyoxylase-like metal-dependent hydrolase (beta-lactamase superfamily II)